MLDGELVAEITRMHNAQAGLALALSVKGDNVSRLSW